MPRQPFFNKNIKRKMRRGFFWIHHCVFDDRALNPSDKVVYQALCRFVNSETQECFPSMRTLVDCTGLSENTIRTKLKHLNELNYIEIDSADGKVNYYQINEPPQKLNPLKLLYNTPSNNDALPPQNIATNKNKSNNNNITISFNDFWELYDKKVGLKDKIKKKWNNLTEKDRKEVMAYIPKYKEATKEKRFRKNPETFLNNRSWEDEIINSENPKVKKAFFEGSPMWYDKSKGKWFVRVDGEFKEFAGKEKDMVWKLV